MSSEIKIHLVSVLDDAGYKATDKKTKETAATVEKEIERILKKRQEYERSIEGMAKKTIQNMDKERAHMDALKGKLEELPGPIGKVATEFLKAHKGIANFVGKSMIYLAAFKAGWDIGTWINDKIVTPLLGIKDPIEELKKENRRLARAAKEEARLWTEAQKELVAQFEKEREALKDSISEIDRKTQAYIRLQNAVKSVSDALDDNELLSLQRDKYHDMNQLVADPKAMTQVGKYWDIVIAEKKAAKAVADAEHSQQMGAEKLASDRKALRKENMAVVQAKRELKRYQDELKKIEDDKALRKQRDPEVIRKAEEELQGKIHAAERRRHDAEVARDKRADEIRIGEVAQQELALKKRNAEEAGKLELDKLTQEYNAYLEEVKREEEEKARREWEKTQEALRKEEKERERMEKRLADKRLQDDIRNLQKEVSERQKALSEAESRLSQARSASDTAWGWFRDKNSLKSFMEEKKANEDAEKEFQRQFSRLKRFRSDWRTANSYGSGGMHALSLEEEAVRQVALTRENENDAQKAVIESRDYLEWIKAHLEQVEAMKE